MPDIFLYHDEVAPTDIILRGPTAASSTVGVPIEASAGATQPRQVYYQSLFIPIYLAAASLAAQPGWQAPLSVAAPVAKAQAGFATVPLNTAQLSVNFTTFGWQSQPPTAPPVAQAQVGFSFVPLDTRQLSVNFTNFGWHGQTWAAAPVARAQAGFSFVPLNTAQLSVNFTNYGWHGPLAGAPPVAKAYPGNAFVPYNTAQVIVAAYTNFWLQPLSVAAPVAKAVQGSSFVPFNTAQVAAAVSTATAIPLDMGVAPPRLRTVYYQAKFEPPLVTPLTPIPLDMGGVLPQLRVLYAKSYFLPPYPTVQRPDNTVDISKWQQPLSVAAPVAKAVQGNSFVPFNTAQLAAPIGIPLQVGDAPPRLRQVYYQAVTLPAYVAPVAVAGIAGIAWFAPLGTVPTRTLAAPQGNSFVPYNTAQVAPTPYTAYYLQPLSIPRPVAQAAPGFWFVPFNTVQVEPPSELGGTTSRGGGTTATGGFCRKKWKKCLEEIRQQLADEQASLKAAKQRHDEIDYAARAARIAAIQASAEALEAECAAESLAVASARIERFIDKLARIEADYQAALLRQFEDDEDDVMTILLT